MKKLLSLVLSFALMATLTGCGIGSKTEGMRIGILQFAEHPSLDNCRQGFLDELQKRGVKKAEIDYQNAGASVESAATIAKKMVADGCSLIVAIATPAAQAAYNATLDTDIPVVYIAVSDPEAAGLTTEGANITGVSDALNVNAQIQLVKKYVPDAKTIGVLYSSNEVNASVQVLHLLGLCMEYGYGMQSAPVSSVDEVENALASILPKSDVIVNLLDNTVVSAMDVIVRDATAAKIPIIGSEEEQVNKGAIASEGYDYVSVGKQAATIALRIIKGEKSAGQIPFELAGTTYTVTNEQAMAELGITESTTQTNSQETDNTEPAL